MEKIKKMNYSCHICNKTYKLKHNFDNHVNLCKFLSKSEKELDNEDDLHSESIPNNFEMFQIIKHMSKKINKLEDTIKYLKARDNKQINVLEYLNKYKNEFPNIGFHKWLEEDIISLLPNYLEMVFRDGLILAITKLFENYKLTSKDVFLPIYVYQKGNIQNVYVYDNSKWKEINNGIMDEYIKYICKEFVTVFVNNWYEKNKLLIQEQEKYKDLFGEYYKKILGGNCKEEKINLQIRNCIKKCFKSCEKIVNYEQM